MICVLKGMAIDFSEQTSLFTQDQNQARYKKKPGKMPGFLIDNPAFEVVLSLGFSDFPFH